ncbi:type II secretion system minor pseudopilin GspI [Endozoicomonas sp. OPT23]|uniref:type II secretion system minor pseudopilin GspI n=1 Tax=Endozoicomonas sp. OPT23 TaxID=2072845 RepID=UPI001891EB75|nr:type II secretion system minor pseudopilin GspI [Endozoicomonas sp. OPT23]
MSNSFDNRGFTLIEVMVALAVFAVAAAMLMLADGNSIRQTRYMQEKVLAAQLADQHLSRIEAEKKWPDTGLSGQAEVYANHDWYVQRVVRNSSLGDFRKIDIEVFTGNKKPEDNDQAMYSLTTHIRKYKK